LIGKRSGMVSAPSQRIGIWICVTLRMAIRIPLTAISVIGIARMTPIHR